MSDSTIEPPAEPAPTYPAGFIVHAPTGPVLSCQEHAGKLVRLLGFLHAHSVVTTAPAGSQCINCINEAKVLQESSL